MKSFMTVWTLNIGFALVMVGGASAAPLYNEASPIVIHFDVGKSDLKIEKESEEKMKQVAQEMQNYPYAKVEIDGYADHTGSKEANRKVSEQRAMAVRDYLVRHYGIASHRVVTRSFGDERPKNPTNASENRRAEIRVYRLEATDAGSDRPTL